MSLVTPWLVWPPKIQIWRPSRATAGIADRDRQPRRDREVVAVPGSQHRRVIRGPVVPAEQVRGAAGVTDTRSERGRGSRPATVAVPWAGMA